MNGTRRFWKALLPLSVVVFSSLFLAGCEEKSEHPKGEQPKAEQPKKEHPKPKSTAGKWIKFYGDEVRLSSLDCSDILTAATPPKEAKLRFFYHGPPLVDDMELWWRTSLNEGLQILERSDKAITFGLAVWDDDVAFHRYNEANRTYEVYLLPEHLLDKDAARILLIPVTKFTAPGSVQNVRVFYLP